MTIARLAPALIALALLGCTGSTTPPGGPATSMTPTTPTTLAPPATPTTSANIDRDLAARLDAIAAEYVGYGRVDDEMRWAPYLCRMPSAGVAHMSAAAGGGHARKLYSVFVKDRRAYGAASAPVGQVVVKQSWVPELVTDEQAVPLPYFLADADRLLGSGDHFHPYAVHEGKSYRAAAPAGLYVMAKIGDAETAGTDQGWIYGTVDTEGVVTSAGEVASCMGCHEKAPHDRLFGLQPSAY